MIDRRRSTITDVARHAGVSIKTVSRVLNREKYVGVETQARIEASIAALGFHPSAAARTLAGGRSRQIALLCDNPSPYYVYEIQAGVRARCAEQSVRMIAQPTDRDAPNLLEDIVSLIEDARPDGLILTPPVTDRADVTALLEQRGIRYTCISPAILSPKVSATYIDNQAAATDMMNTLIGLGHKRIGCVSGDPVYATSALRLAGYKAALRDSGLPLDPELIVVGRYDFASGEEACARLLGLANPPTAIFAGSDDIAAGAVAMAHRLGITIPEQLSIAGFDDTALASIIWPPLTTIRQPVRDLGYAAADLLFASGDPVEHRKISYKLIMRASVGPLRS